MQKQYLDCRQFLAKDDVGVSRVTDNQRGAAVPFRDDAVRAACARAANQGAARGRLLGVLLLGLVGSALAQSRPMATVAEGDLVGIRDHGVRVFLGIPYAAPPVGERRWRPPAPAPAWDGARDASRHGPACPQPEDRFSGHTPLRQDEDCLYLNVWTPAEADGPLPVMVWLHGGAHRIGAGSLHFYDGAALARRGAVVVMLNYRLGYLGYFDHPALEAEGHGGNYGLMDQIRALEWVGDNIAAFGGDPDRVTVFGESAGGADVLYLMTSPAAHGLFQRAAVQSGGGWNQPDSRDAMRESVVSGLASVGVPEDADAGALRDLDPRRLVEAQAGTRKLGFGPFLDRKVTFEAPSEVFADGRAARVPLIIGSNSWEANLLKFREPGLMSRIVTHLPPVTGWYDAAASAAERGKLLFRDVVFGAPARWVARHHAEHAPAWLYLFDYVTTAERGESPGAGHAAEIVYVFDNIGTAGSAVVSGAEEDARLADALADCWVAFAREGAPRCALADWTPYDPAEDNVLLIDRDPRQASHPYGDVLDGVSHWFGPGGLLGS